MSISISCATDKELLTMRGNSKYTDYWLSIIFNELEKRGLV